MRHRFLLGVQCALPPCHFICLLLSGLLAHGIADSLRPVAHEQRIDGSRPCLLPLPFAPRPILPVSSTAHFLRSFDLRPFNLSLVVHRAVHVAHDDPMHLALQHRFLRRVHRQSGGGGRTQVRHHRPSRPLPFFAQRPKRQNAAPHAARAGRDTAASVSEPPLRHRRQPPPLASCRGRWEHAKPSEVSRSQASLQQM